MRLLHLLLGLKLQRRFVRHHLRLPYSRSPAVGWTGPQRPRQPWPPRVQLPPPQSPHRSFPSRALKRMLNLRPKSGLALQSIVGHWRSLRRQNWWIRFARPLALAKQWQPSRPDRVQMVSPKELLLLALLSPNRLRCSPLACQRIRQHLCRRHRRPRSSRWKVLQHQLRSAAQRQNSPVSSPPHSLQSVRLCQHLASRPNFPPQPGRPSPQLLE